MLAGVQSLVVQQQEFGKHVAELCCNVAGIGTVKALLNGQVIGQPVTLPIKAASPFQLIPVQETSLHCIAGLPLPN